MLELLRESKWKRFILSWLFALLVALLVLHVFHPVTWPQRICRDLVLWLALRFTLHLFSYDVPKSTAAARRIEPRFTAA